MYQEKIQNKFSICRTEKQTMFKIPYILKDIPNVFAYKNRNICQYKSYTLYIINMCLTLMSLSFYSVSVPQ